MKNELLTTQQTITVPNTFSDIERKIKRNDKDARVFKSFADGEAHFMIASIGISINGVDHHRILHRFFFLLLLLFNTFVVDAEVLGKFTYTLTKCVCACVCAIFMYTIGAVVFMFVFK